MFNPDGALQQAAMSECALIQSLDPSFRQPRPRDHWGCAWWRDHVGLWKRWPDGRKEFVTARGRVPRPTKAEVERQEATIRCMGTLGAAVGRRLDELCLEAIRDAE